MAQNTDEVQALATRKAATPRSFFVIPAKAGIYGLL